MARHDPDLDALFLALGDPTRRAVIARLTRGTATVSELAQGHNIALPTFMAHLGKLERAGLIRTEKVGRVRRCALDSAALAPARSWIDEQRTLWEARLDQFDAHVAQLMEDDRYGP